VLTPTQHELRNSQEPSDPLQQDRGSVTTDAENNDITLIKQAVGEGRQVYVLVNTRSEGNAPLTVQGLVESLTIFRAGCWPIFMTD
jgi:hypothetical protein